MFHDDHGDAGQQAQSGTQSSGGNPPQDDSQGMQPTGGNPAQDDGSQGDDSQAADFRPRPPDAELGIGQVGDFATTIAVPAHPNTTFDEVYFLKMLSGSISLTKNEKKKIVESVPKLSQYQIDELIKIFEEERRKFAELDEKHQVKIRELQSKQMEDWRDLEMEGKQQEQKGEDDAAAAALRAKLMGGNDQNKAA